MERKRERRNQRELAMLSKTSVRIVDMSCSLTVMVTKSVHNADTAKLARLCYIPAGFATRNQ